MIKENRTRLANNLTRLSILLITTTCFLVALPGFWRAPASSVGLTARPSVKSVVPAGAPLNGPVITASMTDSLAIDNDNAGIADPGDRIRYSIDIANTGSDATNLSFTDTIDSNTTLVGGSVTVTPIAFDDAYANVIGNTRFEATTINTGLLANDIDPDNPAAVLGTDLVVKAGSVAKSGGSVIGNGTLNVAANGTFTYDPPVGETGTETFTYVITDDDALDSVSTGTVTFTISELVWYIDDTAPMGGDGRSSTPFNSLAPVNGAGGAGDADEPGHIIFVFEGSGTYTGGIELEMNQRLIGQGVDLVVNPGGGPITLVNATNKPTITNNAGNGVMLASGNTVRGLIAQTTAGGANFGIGGTGVGALNIDTVMAMGNPGAGVDIQTSGTLAVTFQSISSDNGSRGVRLTNVGGGTFTSNSTTITNGAGDGIDIQSSNTATFTFTGLDVTTTTGRGIVANNGGTVNVGSGGTVNATGGAAVDIESTAVSMPFGSLSSTNSSANGVRLNTVSGSFSVSGTTSIQNSTGDSVSLQGNTIPTIGFNTLNIGNTTAVNGRGLFANNNATVNVTGGSITTSGAAADANRAAVDITNTQTGMTFSSLSSTNSNAQGMNMNGVSGSFSVTGTTNVQNSSGIGVQVQGTSATVSLGNTTSNGSGNTGVRLDNNTGNVSFGDLDITPDMSQRGLHATNNVATSGMLTSMSGTISTNSAIAVDISRTTGGGPPVPTIMLNVTLTSVSASSATSGILLTNTTGSFTIAGDGTLARNGSGGTITGTTDDGIVLNNANNVTLRSMNLTNNGNTAPSDSGQAAGTTPDHTIESVGGSNIILSGVLIQNPIASGWQALNLQGTNGINNDCLITGVNTNNYSGVRVINTDTNLTMLEMNDSNFTNSGSGQSMVLFESAGSSNMRLDVLNGCVFEGLFAQAVTAAPGQTAGTTGAMTTNIGGPNMSDGNIFQNASTAGSGGENNVGVVLANGATHNFLIQNNLFDNIAKDGSIANTSVVRTQNSGGTMTGTVANNIIRNINIQFGGGRHGIGHVFEPPSSGSFSTDLIIDDNDIDDLPAREAIFVDYRATAAGGSVTITNNRIGQLTGSVGQIGGTQQAIELRGRTTTAQTVNVLIDGNTVTASCSGNSFLDVDCEDSTTMNATITNNNFTNTNATPSQTIDMASEDSGSTLCANVSGNTLNNSPGTNNGTITVSETAGTLNVTQASAAALASANSIPAGNVTVNGTPDFNQPACMTPSVASSALASGTGKIETLRAAEGEGPGGKRAGKLEESELSWMVRAAIERWAAAGITGEKLALIENTKFEINDLPGAALAQITSSGIVIDRTAAGYGWYVDAAPYDDQEFEEATREERRASEISLAYGKIDLLTVVMRELAYVLTREYPQDVRARQAVGADALATSVRRVPEGKVGKVEDHKSSKEVFRARAAESDSGSQSFKFGVRDIVRAFSYTMATVPSWTMIFNPSIIVEPVSYIVSKLYAPTVMPSRANDKTPALRTGASANLVTEDKQTAQNLVPEFAVHRTGNLKPHVPITQPEQVAVKAVRATLLAGSANAYIERVKYVASRATNSMASPVAGETVNLGPFTLPADKAFNVMFEADINATITPVGTTQVCNQGTITADGGINVLTDDPDVGGMADPTCTTLASADLQVTKSASPDPDVFAGGNITYTIDLTNNGLNDAANVDVTDAVPANTTFVSAQVLSGTGWSVSAPAPGGTGNVVFSKASVANTETAQFEIVVMVNGATPDGTTITNNATASAGTPDPMAGNNTGTAMTNVVAQVDLSLTKSDSPDPVVIGQNITYTIDLSNAGPGNATNVTVTDAVPANTTFVSAQVLSGMGWSISSPAVGGTGNVVFSKATVANAETAQFEIVVNVNAATACGTTITNMATAANDTPDTNPGNNTAMATTATNAPPSITCPANITVNNDAGQCGASVMFNVTGSGCPAPTIECRIGAMVITSPHTFPVGTTTVDCTASNGIMPDAMCSFTVTVNDTEAPVINCPAPIVRNNDAGQCSAVVNFTATATDNCPIGAPLCVPPSGSSFAVGTTTVNCSVSDQGGNQANCSFAVTVNDTENPTITCPANVTATTAGAGTTSVVVNYPAPMTADNCGVASVVCNPPSGSSFPLGTTTVTCTVTDTSGNTAQCSFTVTTFDVCIEDNASPGNAILFISTGANKGDYQICCGGQTLTGRGTVGLKNGIMSLVHFTSTRRVQAFLYMNQQRGTAALQSPPSAFPCAINDTNVTNNNCSCGAP